MYIVEKEISMEFASIKRSVELVQTYEDKLLKYFENKKSCWFIGSGSSYFIAKSAASLIHLRCGIPAYSIAAGDMMLHFNKYKKALEGSIVVFLSRSGATTEALISLEFIKQHTNAQCISICAVDSAQLIDECEFSIRIPWAFDESVCQTRTVGSIYASTLMMAAIISKITD